jgi:hypothetical protein
MQNGQNNCGSLTIVFATIRSPAALGIIGSSRSVRVCQFGHY